MLKLLILRFFLVVTIAVLLLNVAAVTLFPALRDDLPALEQINETNAYRLTLLKTLPGHNNDEVKDFTFTHAGNLISVGMDSRIVVWDVNSTSTHLLPDFRTLPSGGLFSDDGTTIVCTCGDSSAHYVHIRAADGRNRDKFLFPWWSPHKYVLSSDSRYIAMMIGGTPGRSTFEVWNIDNNNRMTIWENDDRLVSYMQFSPDNTSIASSDINFIRIRNIREPDEEIRMYQFLQPQDGAPESIPLTVAALAYNADGTEVVTMSNEGIVYRWDTATGELLAYMQSDEPVIDFDDLYFTPDHGLAFNPTERLIAAAGGDVLRLWDMKTGTDLITLLVDPNIIRFSPDGTLLASAGHYGEIALWGVPAQ